VAEAGDLKGKVKTMANRPKFDPFRYIRDYYGVPAYKGMRVNVYGKEGVIESADGAYIVVRVNGEKHARPYHPTDGVTYLVEGVNA
jgi:hypothetical protein